MRTTTPSSLSKPPPEPVHHQGRSPRGCPLLTQSGHRRAYPRPFPVAMRMLRRTDDDGLQAAAEMVLSKVTVTLPDTLREHLIEPPFFVSHHGAPPPPVADLAAIRAAIRDERKLRIAYGDEKDARTERTIWPFAIAY